MRVWLVFCIQLLIQIHKCTVADWESISNKNNEFTTILSKEWDLVCVTCQNDQKMFFIKKSKGTVAIKVSIDELNLKKNLETLCGSYTPNGGAAPNLREPELDTILLDICVIETRMEIKFKEIAESKKELLKLISEYNKEMENLKIANENLCETLLESLDSNNSSDEIRYNFDRVLESCDEIRKKIEILKRVAAKEFYTYLKGKWEFVMYFGMLQVNYYIYENQFHQPA